MDESKRRSGGRPHPRRRQREIPLLIRQRRKTPFPDFRPRLHRTHHRRNPAPVLTNLPEPGRLADTLGTVFFPGTSHVRTTPVAACPDVVVNRAQSLTTEGCLHIRVAIEPHRFKFF